jgi:hypothetical protein
MAADIAETRRPEQRITKGVDKYIAVGVRGQALLVGNSHSTQH